MTALRAARRAVSRIGQGVVRGVMLANSVSPNASTGVVVGDLRWHRANEQRLGTFMDTSPFAISCRRPHFLRCARLDDVGDDVDFGLLVQ